MDPPWWTWLPGWLALPFAVLAVIVGWAQGQKSGKHRKRTRYRRGRKR